MTIFTYRDSCKFSNFVTGIPVGGVRSKLMSMIFRGFNHVQPLYLGKMKPMSTHSFFQICCNLQLVIVGLMEICKSKGKLTAVPPRIPLRDERKICRKSFYCSYTVLYGGFLKWWYPQIIHFNRVFHYKPSMGIQRGHGCNERHLLFGGLA